MNDPTARPILDFRPWVAGVFVALTLTGYDQVVRQPAQAPPAQVQAPAPSPQPTPTTSAQPTRPNTDDAVVLAAATAWYAEQAKKAQARGDQP